MKTQQALVVIPAYNEESSIESVLNEVQKSVPEATCLVIDDCSKDQTAAIARRLGARVISLPYNLGVGGAMRVGFNYALRNQFNIVVQVDGDGQHNPADIPELISCLEECDLVIGARFAGKGEYQISATRFWAIKTLSSVLSKLLSVELTDATSGFRASGTRAVKFFATHYPAEYLGDTIEATVLAARSDLVIKQVPVEMRQRQGGVPSQNAVKAAIYLARACAAALFAFLRPKVPQGS